MPPQEQIPPARVRMASLRLMQSTRGLGPSGPEYSLNPSPESNSSFRSARQSVAPGKRGGGGEVDPFTTPGGGDASASDAGLPALRPPPAVGGALSRRPGMRVDLFDGAPSPPAPPSSSSGPAVPALLLPSPISAAADADGIPSPPDTPTPTAATRRSLRHRHRRRRSSSSSSTTTSDRRRHDAQSGPRAQAARTRNARTLTLPRRSTRPALPPAFFSEAGDAAATSAGAGSSGRGTPNLFPAGGPSLPSALRTPDRFVPRRDTQAGAVQQRYRTTKDWAALSVAERILRNNTESDDPFVTRQRPYTPMIPPELRRGQESRGSRPTGEVLGLLTNALADRERQASNGTVWTVGGIAPSGAVDDGRGHFMQSGTNARIFPARFATNRAPSSDEMEQHEGRLASALDIDRVVRVLDFGDAPRLNNNSPVTPLSGGRGRSATLPSHGRTLWDGSTWTNNSALAPRRRPETRSIPTAPFKVLDAQGLRDDFYCSVLAYSPTCHTLAVALGNLLYAWSETDGMTLLNAGLSDGSWITSVSFSSAQGGKCILAYGRTNGTLALMSLYDSLVPRFEFAHQHAIACLSWRPVCTTRASSNPVNPGVPVRTEDLLVGDECGHVDYYIVEWPASWEVARDGWPGCMTLVARLAVHTQQICGLAWSLDGAMFSTGGNDNLCCLFEAAKVLAGLEEDDEDEHEHEADDDEGDDHPRSGPGRAFSRPGNLGGRTLRRISTPPRAPRPSPGVGGGSPTSTEATLTPDNSTLSPSSEESPDYSMPPPPWLHVRDEPPAATWLHAMPRRRSRGNRAGPQQARRRDGNNAGNNAGGGGNHDADDDPRAVLSRRFATLFDPEDPYNSSSGTTESPQTVASHTGWPISPTTAASDSNDGGRNNDTNHSPNPNPAATGIPLPRNPAVSPGVIPTVSTPRRGVRVPLRGPRHLYTGSEKHRFPHRAAVKAMAWCPWLSGLLATGGGSNDKCIHFFHAGTGTPLATIAVSAQVTGLIWSRTRREIAATFGYAQPEHPVRIAVFAWPSCRQVASVPWDNAYSGVGGRGGAGGNNREGSNNGGGDAQTVDDAGDFGGGDMGDTTDDMDANTNAATAGGVATPSPAIPGGELRALYAIPYPSGRAAQAAALAAAELRDAVEGRRRRRGPQQQHGEGGGAQATAASSPPYSSSSRRRRRRRSTAPTTALDEGCIVVAASDESIKFHEVWGPDSDPRGEGGGGGGCDSSPPSDDDDDARGSSDDDTWVTAGERRRADAHLDDEDDDLGVVVADEYEDPFTTPGLPARSGRRGGRFAPARPPQHRPHGGLVVSGARRVRRRQRGGGDDKTGGSSHYSLFTTVPGCAGVGILGGSDILEDMEGIDKEGDVIR